MDGKDVVAMARTGTLYDTYVIQTKTLFVIKMQSYKNSF